VSHRALALVSALTAGDFLLWNWSLSGGRVVLALVSGLTLPPLAAACVLLLAINAARLASRFTRRSALAVTSQRTGARGRAALRSSREMSPSPIPLDDGGTPVSATAPRSPRPARKLAA
jgi:hypothetical protein